MTATIPRLANIWEDAGPGWAPDVRSDGRPCHPLVKCRCGAILHVTAHTVHKGGRLTASFYHRFEPPAPPREIERSCGWHEFLILEGWSGGLIRPEVRA